MASGLRATDIKCYVATLFQGFGLVRTMLDLMGWLWQLAPVLGQPQWQQETGQHNCCEQKSEPQPPIGGELKLKEHYVENK